MPRIKIQDVLSLVAICLVFLACEEAEVLQQNHIPVITEVGSPAGGVMVGDSTTLICQATDADGDAVFYFWTAAAGSLSGSGNEVIWTPPTQAARYPFEIRVEDSHGGYVERAFFVQVFDLGQ